MERKRINKRKKRKRGERTLKDPNLRNCYQVLSICNSQAARGLGGADSAPFSGVGRSLVGAAVVGR